MTKPMFLRATCSSLLGLIVLSCPLHASPLELVNRIVEGDSLGGASIGNGGTLNPPTTLDPDFGSIGNLGNPYATPGSALGHWGVGNGGDWLRLGFARARDHASNIVNRLRPESLRSLADAELKNWIIENRAALASDILATEHVWELEEQVTCAWTLRPREGEKIPTNYPIQFSFPKCSENTMSFYQATQLLIHEAVHHFNGDEDLADKVAIAVVDAWRNGQIEWLPVATENAPLGRTQHAAVWTGTEMIVFGGQNKEEVFSDGASYDPDTNLWTAIPEFNGLEGRYSSQAEWTGDQMVVWGGYVKPEPSVSVWAYEGFIYKKGEDRLTKIKGPMIPNPNPDSDTPFISEWMPEAYTLNLDPRQKAVWTGDKLAVWGGLGKDGAAIGGIYDPKTETWDLKIREDYNAPVRIGGHSLNWTGDKLIVWGGYTSAGPRDYLIQNTGAIYDPSLPEGERWKTMSTEGAPTARAGHVAVWTGRYLIVFSGGGVQSSPDLAGTGGIYDLETDSWQPIRSEMVIDRIGHTATWNGHEMLVFGGRSKRLSTYLGQVFSFDPENRRWNGVNTSFDPKARMNHTAVWTGSSLIVWGGFLNDRSAPYDQRDKFYQTGGIFYP